MDAIQFRTHSCDECKKMVFDLREKFHKSVKALLELSEQIDDGTFPKPREESSRDGEEENMVGKGAIFDMTLGDFWAGAAAGCQLFSTILDDEWISRDTILSYARKDLPIDDPNSKLGWAFRDSSLWHEDWLGELLPENTLRNLCPGKRDALRQCRLWAAPYQGTANPLDIEIIRFFGLWDPVTKKIVYRTRHGFQVFTHADDAAASAVSTRPIARYPGSGAGLMKTASWLHNCQENHSCKIIPGAMPTRLIQVTGTLETDVVLRLCDMAKEVSVPYAALSYCWGGEQPMKCLRSNINSYRTSIPFDGQPETIKDAARVCLGAGIKYLWIDALCIIQDDPDDKPNEIAQMPSIYGGATVTIVAAGSASVTQGFLGERTPGCFEAAVVPYRCLDGELGSITLVKLGGLLESVVEPIDQRGWTLQERLLSSRIIEFGSWQTRWICSESKLDGFSLEGFTDGWKRDVPYGSTRRSEALDLDIIRTTKFTVDFYGRPRASQFQEHTKAMRHWENICVSFTERTLTLSADRALAISGIAQIFAQYSGDQNLAGLWKSYFHSGLLWKIQHGSTKHKSIPRPIAYQGPSWSWLSVNGSVFFGNARRPSACVAEILSCEVEPANKSAPYGLIREDSGRLVLAAHTAPAMRYRVELRSPGRFKDELMIIGTRPRVACFATAEMCLDIQGEEPDEIEEKAGCLAVEICREHHGDDISCQGLVLRWSSPERKTYSRIGWFSYYGKRKGTRFPEHVEDGESTDVDFDWFSDEPKVIEII